MIYYEWTAERVERLRALAAEGLSCSQIAKALGDCSRNAALGKMARLGIPNTYQPVKRAAPKRETRRNGKGMVGPVRAPQPIPPPVAGSHPKGYKQIMALKSVDCRYIVRGDGPDSWFCAARVEQDGDSYCRQHRAVCYNPTGSARELERGLRRWTA